MHLQLELTHTSHPSVRPPTFTHAVQGEVKRLMLRGRDASLTEEERAEAKARLGVVKGVLSGVKNAEIANVGMGAKEVNASARVVVVVVVVVCICIVALVVCMHLHVRCGCAGV
jgi:hypothetical protein